MSFYAAEFPGGKRFKASKTIDVQEPVQPQQVQQPQTISQAPGMDSLPPVPDDYELPTETAQASSVEQVVEQKIQEPVREILQEDTQVQSQLSPEETAQAKNFRQLREAKEKAERERDELLKYLQQQKQQQQPEIPQPSEEDDFAINPDDLVEGKHLKKFASAVKSQVQKELQKYQQELTVTQQRTKLRTDYQDFDKVVNEDTLAILELRYPEIYNTLNTSNGGIYNTGVSTYTMMRNLGIVSDNFESDRNRIKQNTSKPKPVTSISPQKAESPLSQVNAFANGLTSDLQKQLWAEMNSARKRV